MLYSSWFNVEMPQTSFYDALSNELIISFTVMRDGFRFNVEVLQTSLMVEKIRKSSVPFAVNQNLIYGLLRREISAAK